MLFGPRTIALSSFFPRRLRMIRPVSLCLFCAGFVIFCSGSAFAQTVASQAAAQSPEPVLKRRNWPPPAPPATNPPDTLINSVASHSIAPPTIELTLAQGTPIRVVINKSLPVKRVGQPVRAYVTDSVYAFDRVVVPKGSELDGHIVQLVHRSTFRKIASYLNADFSPHRAVHVQFDTLILPNGERVPLQTKVLPHVGPVLKLETNPQKNTVMRRARGLISTQFHDAMAQVKPSALWIRAKSFAASEWPYHKQKIAAGSVFVAELEHPLAFGPATIPASEMGSMGKMPTANAEAYARLVTPLSSATAHVGSAVDAVLMRPVFSADNKLLLPVNTQLHGIVVRAKPARRLHRNGQLHFKLTRVQLPSNASQPVEMALEGIEVPKASHIQVDSEGATHVAGNARSRVLSTALSVAIANSTLDSDSGHAGATAQSENRPLGGASGYKLIGFAVSFAAASPMLSRVMGFWGAGESVYVHFITRGQNLVLPEDTPMEISFGEPRVRPIANGLPRVAPTAAAKTAALK
jgi:hypothetical protein